MSVDFMDVFFMGATVGSMIGSYVTYEIGRYAKRKQGNAKVTVRSPAYVTAPVIERATRKQEDKPHPWFGVSLQPKQTAREVMRKPAMAIPIVPVNASGRGKVTMTEVYSPYREEVVAALVDSGFKKTAATTAADMVALGDRLSAETWIVAALRNASSAK